MFFVHSVYLAYFHSPLIFCRVGKLHVILREKQIKSPHPASQFFLMPQNNTNQVVDVLEDEGAEFLLRRPHWHQPLLPGYEAGEGRLRLGDEDLVEIHGGGVGLFV